MGALGYAWLSSNTLRDGFRRIQRYVKILGSQLGISVDNMGDNVSISLDYDCSLARATSGLAILTHLCRLNYQDELSPSKVTFIHPTPDDASKYFSYFGCPIEFDADVNSINFPASVIDEELVGGDDQLAKLNDQVLIQYINTLTQDDLVNTMKTIIVKDLPSGEVRIDAVAEELYTSSRTLQRKLKELGTTYKKIYTECQKYLAEKYVSEGKMSFTEISFILGFSEMSSFSRSYKRWTGHSPNADRAN
jgi:AraC-like DNA-binding protein